MLTWADLRDSRRDLAEAGRALLYQFGVGLGFLGTVRRDPRKTQRVPDIARVLEKVCDVVASDLVPEHA